MSAIRVLLAEDHETVRDGLKVLLQSQTDIEIVGEVSNGRAAVERAQALKPHVLVLDLSMPEMNGLGNARAEGARQVAVVALTCIREATSASARRRRIGIVLKQARSASTAGIPQPRLAAEPRLSLPLGS